MTFTPLPFTANALHPIVDSLHLGVDRLNLFANIFYITLNTLQPIIDACVIFSSSADTIHVFSCVNMSNSLTYPGCPQCPCFLSTS